MDNKPQIPTLKDSQNKPQLKIKGLASGMSLIERLKQFKKKDLAFILAGLGVLFMAPLAEHFMMDPNSSDSAKLGPGFGGASGGNPFGNGSSPYETGVNGMAPGGVAGGGSDVITPLNVRDPSALVMSPGATQTPPAGSTPAPTPPPSAPSSTKDDTKWNDAIAAGKAAASAATKKASLPVPKVPLSAGGLRGLGAASGGSGSSFSLPGINASNVPNRPGESGSGLNNIRGGGNIKGVTRGLGNGGNAGALEALKKNAAAAGGDFNRAGNASSALEAAASRSMGEGTEGSGGGGQRSGEDKATAQSQNKDSKSPGESLDFLRMKQEQEKAIDLKWKLKEKDAMLWPNLKEKMLEEAVMTPFKAITGSIAEMFKGIGSGAADSMMCNTKADATGTWMQVKKSDVSACGGTPKPGEGTKYCKQPGGDLAYPSNPGSAVLFKCSPVGGDSPTAGKKEDITPGFPSGVGDITKPIEGGKPLGDICAALQGQLTASGSNAAVLNADGSRKTFDKGTITAALESAKALAQVKNAFTGLQDDMTKCSGSSLLTSGKGHIPGRLTATGEHLVYTIGIVHYDVMKPVDNNAAAINDKAKQTPEKVANPLGTVKGDTEADKETKTQAVADAKKGLTVIADGLTPIEEALGKAQKALDDVSNFENEPMKGVGAELATIKTDLGKVDESLRKAREISGKDSNDADLKAQITQLTAEQARLNTVYTTMNDKYTNQQKAFDNLKDMLKQGGVVPVANSAAQAVYKFPASGKSETGVLPYADKEDPKSFLYNVNAQVAGSETGGKELTADSPKKDFAAAKTEIGKIVTAWDENWKKVTTALSNTTGPVQQTEQLLGGTLSAKPEKAPAPLAGAGSSSN